MGSFCFIRAPYNPVWSFILEGSFYRGLSGASGMWSGSRAGHRAQGTMVGQAGAWSNRACHPWQSFLPVSGPVTPSLAEGFLGPLGSHQH